MQTWTDLIMNWAVSWGPMLLFVLVWLYLMKRSPWFSEQRRHNERSQEHMERVEHLLERIATALER